MSLQRLDAGLARDIARLKEEGRAKAPERVIVDYMPAQGARGPRYKLSGQGDQPFLRMNSNSYMSLSHHPRMLEAADKAAHVFGVGPGAVRFIDGTFHHHIELEHRIAAFMGRPAAKIFNSAYTTNLGLALSIQNKQTYWIGDQLNHNCIIRAMRIANVPRHHKAIYPHNDMDGLKQCLEAVPEGIDRVIVITDGVFSMRGDTAPLQTINALVAPHRDRFAEGLITVADDSHGVAAFGETGRGTEEIEGAQVDVVIGTFGKGFGVNGGFVVGSETLIEAIRQKADTYIYTNPLSVADCAAAIEAVDIVDSDEGRALLQTSRARIAQFRAGLERLGLESIPGEHPVVPLMVRDGDKTVQLVNDLFERGILVIGLRYPVVPHGDESIRFQINSAHTEADIDEVLNALEALM
ncbi:MAG: aminotransferase class I/II-fold pyridoxal phosphate-dependent enzyme [Myxococcota bacterium]